MGSGTLAETVARGVFCLGAALWITGCSASGSSPYFGKTVPPDGQELRYISGSEPESLDPQLATGQPEARIQLALFDGLTEYDPQTAQAIPSLASSWDANGDNSEFVFHLRADARWSDGSPITAEDVVYTWRRGLTPAVASRAAFMAYDILYAQAFNEGAVFVRDPRTGSFLSSPSHPAARLTLPPGAEARAHVLESLETTLPAGVEFVPVSADDVGVQALDPHTLRVHMQHSIPFFPKILAHQFFRPVQRRVVEAYGDRWTRPEHIVTSGSFTLESWRPYDAIVVRKNPGHWDAGNTRLDRITFYAIEDLTTMMNLYKAGVVDATFNHTVPPGWIQHMRGFRDHMDRAEASTEYYLINTTKPPMNDPRVRHALNMAIDKDAVARYRRSAKPVTGAVPPGIFPGYPNPAGDAFDPERAKALLAEAGYTDAQGRYDPSRFPNAEVELTYNSSESNRGVAEFVQAAWKQNLGLSISLKNMEFKTFLQVRGRLEYRGVARGGWIGDYMDPFTFLSMFTTEGGDNGTGWLSREFVAALTLANRQPDPARRDELLAKAESLLLDAQPIIPLYSSSTNWMKKPFVKGLYPNPVTMHPWKFVYIEHDPSKWD